jgi:hypothetical protein
VNNQQRRVLLPHIKSAALRLIEAVGEQAVDESRRILDNLPLAKRQAHELVRRRAEKQHRKHGNDVNDDRPEADSHTGNCEKYNQKRMGEGQGPKQCPMLICSGDINVQSNHSCGSK